MASRLKTPCRHPGCPSLTDSRNGYCDVHKIDSHSFGVRGANPYRTLYSTARWARIRSVVLNEDPLCQECLSKGRCTVANVVHHIVDLVERPDLALTRSNLMSLCSSCHSSHTLKQQQGTLNKWFTKSFRINQVPPYTDCFSVVSWRPREVSFLCVINFNIFVS